MDEKGLKEWSNRKLCTLVKNGVTKLFDNILDFSEVAVEDKERYKILRSKVLKLSNDTIRSLVAEIEHSYEVEFKNIYNDVVIVKDSKDKH
jgi:hypothetical protein